MKASWKVVQVSGEWRGQGRNGSVHCARTATKDYLKYLQMMNLKNRMLFQLSKKILARNRKFKNLHKGESCYLFGNGISLKEMDLAKFNDKISIGCSYLWLHNDFDALNTKYYCEPEPFWYYPFYRNKLSGKIERNPYSSLQKRLQKKYPYVSFFTSLSNIFGIRGDNVYYLHHFDNEEPSLDKFRMDEVFYFIGSLHVMIGMAIYMGFKSAYLVGCDYTHSPQRILHFYEKGKGISKFDDNHNADFFKVAQERIDLTTITSVGSTSKTLKYIDYHDYIGAEPVFRENTELVKKKYLDVLAAWPGYSIYRYTPEMEKYRKGT